MHVCVCTCIYVCGCMCVYVFVHMCICMCMCVMCEVCVYVCMCICMCVWCIHVWCVCMCVFVWDMYVCMQVCLCVLLAMIRQLWKWRFSVYCHFLYSLLWHPFSLLYFFCFLFFFSVFALVSGYSHLPVKASLSSQPFHIFTVSAGRHITPAEWDWKVQGSQLPVLPCPVGLLLSRACT